MKTTTPKTFGLPDGTRIPLEYTLPAAEKCRAADPRHCQHAEGLRAVGYSDPQVLPKDMAIIKARYGNYRLEFPVSLATLVPSAAAFDKGHGEPAGTPHRLEMPTKVKEVKKLPSRSSPKAKGKKLTTTQKRARKLSQDKNARARRRSHVLKFAKTKS